MTRKGFMLTDTAHRQQRSREQSGGERGGEGAEATGGDEGEAAGAPAVLLLRVRRGGPCLRTRCDGVMLAAVAACCCILPACLCCIALHDRPLLPLLLVWRCALCTDRHPLRRHRCGTGTNDTGSDHTQRTSAIGSALPLLRQRGRCSLQRCCCFCFADPSTGEARDSTDHASTGGDVVRLARSGRHRRHTS